MRSHSIGNTLGLLMDVYRRLKPSYDGTASDMTTTMRSSPANQEFWYGPTEEALVSDAVQIIIDDPDVPDDYPAHVLSERLWDAILAEKAKNAADAAFSELVHAPYAACNARRA